MAEENKTIARKKKRDPVGIKVYLLYVAFLMLSIAIIVRLIHIQFFYNPSPKITAAMTPSSTKESIEPDRGAILAKDGRLLAMSIPFYDIYMDCTVRKAEFKENAEHGDSLEKEWMDKARKLAEGLSRIIGDKSADQYFKLIRDGRYAGKKYQRICSGIDRKTLNLICELPLFEEGSYKGGLIVEKENLRQYPYGKLARRTIGFVRNNKSSAGNTHVGIEGKFDYILHGKTGYEWQRQTDNKRKVRDFDSLYVAAENGLDVHTTLDIDIQDIADKALREQIEADLEIEGGCAVVMDVKTGAIRAMVNLLRDSTSQRLEESQNLAIGRLGEPGSVFKSVNLMSHLEDRKLTTLDYRIPTNHGILRPFTQDDYITKYEKRHGVSSIPVIDGFAISSNYVFRRLAIENYGTNPQSYMDKIYMYKLGEAFDFDLEGMATPVIPNPKDHNSWSGTSLGSVAIGYSVSETPLHILTFYNAIANGGREMKPYLVEDIEKNGIVVEKMGPSVLNASICSKATADTLTRALRAVVEYGTGSRLKNDKYSFAGKTGTARVSLPQGGYTDAYGRKKHQGTFVGFFPAEDPKYSMIVVVYSKLTSGNFYGGTKPAATARAIADFIYTSDPAWSETLERTGSVPPMDRKPVALEEGKVPCVKGLGIKDAIFTLENAGYKCLYSGTGHVSAQIPAEGAAARKGTEINLVLK